MRRYIIERDLQSVGNLSAEQLDAVRRTSNEALANTGHGTQWVESYVTLDRIYCHYLAENAEYVRDHAQRAGLPCTKVSEVRSVVDSLTVTPQAA